MPLNGGASTELGGGLVCTFPLAGREREPASLTLGGNARVLPADLAPRAADGSPVSSGPAGALASGTRGAESMVTAGLRDDPGSRPH